MNLDIEQERQRLAQGKFLEWINGRMQPSESVTAYLNDTTDDHDIGIYCALIPNEHIKSSLQDMSWALSPGDGLPAAVKYYRDGKERVEYYRFGDDHGIEPLVICRSFGGLRDNYQEISEEFRLFHRLYYDKKQDQYIKIDDSGNEQVVVRVEPNSIRIRLQEIKQFLAVKEMHMAVMFDCRENSKASLHELGIEEGTTQHRNGLLAYDLGYGDLSGIAEIRAFSRLLGKRLFPPFAKEKSGFWGFAIDEPKKCIEFIIGIDEEGDVVLCTSDKD